MMGVNNESLKEKKLQLHYWYVGEVKIGGRKVKIASGIVTGHPLLIDSMDISTSEVCGISFDKNAAEMIFTTLNSVYHCPMSYCDFDKQDKYPDILPDYEELKEKYKKTMKFPSIEPGKILLVLSNFSNYYFHSLFYMPEDAKEPLKYRGGAHVGTFQDSFLIGVEYTRIDLRYFPHQQNIEFYSEETEGRPWFIENIGDVVLYAKTSHGTLKLAPGERKEVLEENAEETVPVLPDGDLYPAGIL